MSASESQQLNELYEFGPFRVDPEKEVLLRAGQPVPLTPKTFQILLVLVRHHKEVVTKEDLMKAVWPDTFVEEANLSRNIFMLRKALGESPQDHQYILTVPGRGYRLAEQVRLVPEQEVSIVAAQHSKVEVQVLETTPWLKIVLAAVLLATPVGAYLLLSHRAPVLTEQDTVVLADFANSTGDPVFDGTLRQGLAIQLEQSPFLSIIADQQVQQTLKMMGQQPDSPLKPETAREVCQRTGSSAVIDGGIAKVGAQYLLTLKAVNCANGNSLASAEAEVPDKNQVLDALGKTALEIRSKLGESMKTVQKFDTPLEQATTPSLEALQAYSLGHRAMFSRISNAAAVLHFQRAISLDPSFAMAYARLGNSYLNMGDPAPAAENSRKSYELRGKVSERERFYIESHYEIDVTGNLEAARRTSELWAQTYPRDGVPLGLQAWIYERLGDYEKSLAAEQGAVKLNPATGLFYGNLVNGYLEADRLLEAKAVAREAQTRNLDSTYIHFNLFYVDFLQHDASGMNRESAVLMGEPEYESTMLYINACLAADTGQFVRAREITQRAVSSAQRAGAPGKAARYKAAAALSDALAGQDDFAKKEAQEALALSNDQNTEVRSAIALVLARLGQTDQAEKLAAELGSHFPENTIVQFDLLPSIRAATRLANNNPREAVDALAAAEPYELGFSGIGVLQPVYLRGEAYSASSQESAAVAEFQKILGHPGVVRASLIGVLAHLQLGRAFAKSGDKTKAKQAYQDFLMLWKDADPDIPVLKQAKAEYAKLQ